MVNKGENNPKARAQATSSSSSFKKGINCFNCGYEGHYTHECRKPKRQDGGNAPKARLNALEVHESDLDDIRESDGDHPNTEEQTESLQDPVGDEPELVRALTRSDSEDDNKSISPSSRRDGKYMGLGLGQPPAAGPVSQTWWLMQRSSSGIFSSGSETSVATPTWRKGMSSLIISFHRANYSCMALYRLATLV